MDNEDDDDVDNLIRCGVTLMMILLQSKSALDVTQSMHKSQFSFPISTKVTCSCLYLSFLESE